MSRKYKTNIEPFNLGLDVVKSLRPVTFNWITDKSLDLGLVAEDVEGINPLLVTYDTKGAVEGVKYDRIGVIAVNAIKEQQSQIESLQKTNAKQQAQIEKQQAMIEQLEKRLEQLEKIQQP